MRLTSIFSSLSSILIFAACAQPVEEAAANRPGSGSGSEDRDDDEEREGADVGDADDGGSSSSGQGGDNSLYIVNYSSYDMCYIATCDCDLEECYEDAGYYLESGYYVEYSGLSDGCGYLYVEDCDYGYYWENFVEMDGDYTWELYD